MQRNKEWPSCTLGLARCKGLVEHTRGSEKWNISGENGFLLTRIAVQSSQAQTTCPTLTHRTWALFALELQCSQAKNRQRVRHSPTEHGLRVH